MKRCYKLFRIKNGQLYPLYVLANEPIPVGVWLEAKEGIKASDGKHVKSRLGNLSFRPGYHCSEYPVATHIGSKKDKTDIKPSFRPKNQVWAECEIKTDIHYTDYKSLREVPKNGYYRFKTNANMYGSWLIAGNMKVNRILTDKEVYEINSKTGVHDLPREE